MAFQGGCAATDTLSDDGKDVKNAFEIACIVGNTRVMERLAPIAKIPWSTALYLICQSDNASAFQYAYIRQYGSSLYSYIPEACRHGSLNILKYIASHERENTQINWTDGFICACNNNHEHIIDYITSISKFITFNNGFVWGTVDNKPKILHLLITRGFNIFNHFNAQHVQMLLDYGVQLSVFIDNFDSLMEGGKIAANAYKEIHEGRIYISENLLESYMPKVLVQIVCTYL